MPRARNTGPGQQAESDAEIETTIDPLAGDAPPASAGFTNTGTYAGAPAATPSSLAVTFGGITINLEFDAAAMAAPASARAGIVRAATMLAASISDPITVNLAIDISGTGGGASAGPLVGNSFSYATVRAGLIAGADPGDLSFNALPTGTSIQGQSSVMVWTAEQKALGLLSPTATGVDGGASFATDIDPNLMVGVALHELTHAMGRVPNGPDPDIFDLFRFTSAGQRLFDGADTAPPAYFSIDGGAAKLADYGETSDSSDFLNSGVQGPNDAFNEFYSNGTTQQLSSVDRQQMDVLGFHLVTPGALSLGVVVSAGQTFVVPSGQIATNSTVQNGGLEVIVSGGLARGATVNPGGIEAVRDGGATSGTAIDGGVELVWGRANASTIGTGGVQMIWSGGVATGTRVDTGGAVVAASGGTARGITVGAGGLGVVQAGGTLDGATVADGTLIIQSGGTAGTSTIVVSDGGLLKLDNAAAFGATISGFAGSDHIDLADIAFGASTTLGYSGTATSGTLTVSDGIHSAALHLLGQYSAGSFALLSDGNGGTVVADLPAASAAALQDLVTPRS